MVHEEVDFRTIAFDVPRENVWIRRLEHEVVESQGIDQLRHGVCSPGRDVLRNPFRLDHYQARAGLKTAPSLRNSLIDVACPFCFEFLCGTGTAGTKLNPDLRLPCL